MGCRYLRRRRMTWSIASARRRRVYAECWWPVTRVWAREHDTGNSRLKSPFSLLISLPRYTHLNETKKIDFFGCLIQLYKRARVSCLVSVCTVPPLDRVRGWLGHRHGSFALVMMASAVSHWANLSPRFPWDRLQLVTPRQAGIVHKRYPYSSSQPVGEGFHNKGNDGGKFSRLPLARCTWATVNLDRCEAHDRSL
jgi:hypothetical protein